MHTTEKALTIKYILFLQESYNGNLQTDLPNDPLLRLGGIPSQTILTPSPRAESPPLPHPLPPSHPLQNAMLTEMGPILDTLVDSLWVHSAGVGNRKGTH